MPATETILNSLPLFHWAPDPVLFQLGWVKIRWYSLSWLAAFFLGEFIVARVLRRVESVDTDISLLLPYALAGTIIGARLAHCLFYDPIYYLSHPIKILAIWEGGLASHGGALGFILGILLGIHHSRLKVKFLVMLDAVAPAAALGGTLIRSGNFMNSEIVGKPTGGDYGVIFDFVDTLPRHPVQLYEAFAYLSLFVVLITMAMRNPHRIGSGMLSGLFFLVTFSARIVLEYWKVPQAAYEAGYTVSVGQWLSVPFLLLGLVMVIRAVKSGRAS